MENRRWKLDDVLYAIRQSTFFSAKVCVHSYTWKQGVWVLLFTEFVFSLIAKYISLRGAGWLHPNPLEMVIQWLEEHAISTVYIVVICLPEHNPNKYLWVILEWPPHDLIVHLCQLSWEVSLLCCGGLVSHYSCRTLGAGGWCHDAYMRDGPHVVGLTLARWLLTGHSLSLLCTHPQYTIKLIKLILLEMNFLHSIFESRSVVKVTSRPKTFVVTLHALGS